MQGDETISESERRAFCFENMDYDLHWSVKISAICMSMLEMLVSGSILAKGDEGKRGMAFQGFW